MSSLMSDESALSSALERLGPLGAEALSAWCAICSTRRFAAGTWLLRAGESAECCFLLTRGLVRELYLGEAGAEHTRAFIAEGQFTGSLLDLLSREPAVTWIEALEPTATVAFRYADFQALCERFRDIESIARRHIEHLYVKKTRREYEMLALPAAARHERWLAEFAALDSRILRRHLASYLGITPEHLSRLRRPAHQKSSPPARAR
jgi:CRP-like cAMP-binding protein